MSRDNQDVRVGPKVLVDAALLAVAAYLAFRLYGVASGIPRALSAWTLASVLLAGAAIVVVRALWLPFPRRANAALLAFTVVASGVLGNLILEARGRTLLGLLDTPLARLAASVPSAPAGNDGAPEAAGEGEVVRPPDLRDRGDVIAALAASGVEAVRSPTIHPLLDAADANAIPFVPLSGMAHAVTVHCNEGDQPEFPVHRSDRFGFNNDDTVYAAPGRRVLLLGDSYVYGFCVHQEQTVAGVLRRRGHPAVSLGMVGNGPLLNLAALREYGRAIQPSHVYWFHFDGNDVDDLRDHELRSAALRRYLDSSHVQGLAGRQAEVDRLWRDIFSDREKWERVAREHGDAVAAYRSGDGGAQAQRALEDARKLSGLGGLASVRADADLEKIVVAILGQAKREAEAMGAGFTLVVVRSAASYRAGWKPKHLDAVLAGAKSQGIPVIDVDDRIRGGGDPERYFPRGHQSPHYNAAGYALFASAIAGTLVPRENIQIVEATFGLNCKDFAVKPPNVNVIRAGNSTPTMAAECNGKKSCDYIVGNAKVGGEPADGCSKDFNASWRCGASAALKRLHLPDNAEGKSARASCD